MQHSHSFQRKLVSAVVAGLFAAPAAYAEEAVKTDKIEVVSTTPLPGIGLPANKVPGNIQAVQSKDVEEQAGVSLADFMMNNLQGVTVTDMAGNPYQPEINFRGYSASSLLGNAQGLSTYVDGVRVNEPFGDVTLWDKIPNFAIGGMQLVPGSNPLYGLNTLGGAVAIQTKSGRDFQGIGMEYEFGSWSRQRALVEAGGVFGDGAWDYYVGYQHTTEDGWRDYSPSHVNQAFAKLGWQDEATRLELSYIGTDNNLTGNGFTPETLLRGDNEQIHTRPDFTNNYYHHLALNGSHWINDETMFSGNVYYRKSNRKTLNGDLYEGDNESLEPYSINAEALEDLLDEFCEDEGGEIECVGSALNSSKTSQDNYGFTGQFTFNQDLWGKANQFIIGASYDYSLIRFKQFEHINLFSLEDYEDYEDSLETDDPVDPPEAVFDPTRKPIMEGEGVQNQRQNVGLTGKQYTARLFATDTLSLNDHWHLTAGASWNFTRVDNTDTLNGPPIDEDDASLTAKDSYTRLNPMVGITHTPTESQTWYASYSESSRAPTSIELGCSNPKNPCLLPSAMADDPPLNQVVAKTYEFGGRGKLTDSMRWNAGIYQAVNHDDIQFTSAGASNGAGYYKNIGRTKRQGVDLGLSGNLDKFRWSASYSYIRATYDTDVDFVSASHSEADGFGTITAQKGDYLPGIPKHQLKLRGQYQVTPAWAIGANVIGYSDQYVMGNENNKHNGKSCDGDECAAGNGKVSGYFVMNLDTQYNFGNGWKMFAKAINIFDRDYYVTGRLAETLFSPDGEFGEESKTLGLMPGAPRAGWIGVRYDFNPKK